MKKILMTIAKMAGKWLIGYLPDVALWAVQYGTDKAANNEKVAYVIEVINMIAADAATVSRIMEDGKMTDAEEAEVRERTERIAEDIKGLL